MHSYNITFLLNNMSYTKLYINNIEGKVITFIFHLFQFHPRVDVHTATMTVNIHSCAMENACHRLLIVVSTSLQAPHYYFINLTHETLQCHISIYKISLYQAFTKKLPIIIDCMIIELRK